MFPELTERGKLVVTAEKKTMKEKLITVAMLNYRPVWEVINAITEGDEDFDDETTSKSNPNWLNDRFEDNTENPFAV